MNVALNGQISAAEFKSYCERSPSSMDFLSRLTIGNTGFLQYPQPLNENYQQEQLQKQHAASQLQQQQDQIAENRNQHEIYNNFKIEPITNQNDLNKFEKEKVV